MNVLISACIGALISIMLLFNSTLSQSIGNYNSSILIHSIGLLPILLILIISKTKITIRKNVPLYLYSAGAIGVFTVLFNNMSFSALGASITLALGLFGQSVSSIMIDHFGLLEMTTITFEKKKLIGLAFIIFGILIMTIF